MAVVIWASFHRYDARNIDNIPYGCWLVGCCLKSNSGIFQLYSDGAIVQFSKFRPAASHPTPWAARSLKRAEPNPTRVPGRPITSLTSLPSEGPHAVRVCWESNQVSRPTVKPTTSTQPWRAIPYGGSLFRF